MYLEISQKSQSYAIGVLPSEFEVGDLFAIFDEMEAYSYCWRTNCKSSKYVRSKLS